MFVVNDICPSVLELASCLLFAASGRAVLLAWRRHTCFYLSCNQPETSFLCFRCSPTWVMVCLQQRVVETGEHARYLVSSWRDILSNSMGASVRHWWSCNSAWWIWGGMWWCRDIEKGAEELELGDELLLLRVLVSWLPPSTYQYTTATIYAQLLMVNCVRLECRGGQNLPTPTPWVPGWSEVGNLQSLLDMCHGLGGPQPRGIAAAQRSAMCILIRSSGVWCRAVQCTFRRPWPFTRRKKAASKLQER